MENQEDDIQLVEDNPKDDFIYIPDYPSQIITDDINKFRSWKNRLYNNYENGAIYKCGNKQCNALVFKPKKIEKANYFYCQNCKKYTCFLCNRSIIDFKDICCIKKIFSNLINIGLNYFIKRVIVFKFEEYYEIRKIFLYPYLNLLYLGLNIFEGFFLETFHFNPSPYYNPALYLNHNNQNDDFLDIHTVKDYYKDRYCLLFYLYYLMIICTYVSLTLPLFIYYYFIVVFFIILLNLILHFTCKQCFNHKYQKAIFGLYAQCCNIRALINHPHLHV
jgi:hypothetical protein